MPFNKINKTHTPAQKAAIAAAIATIKSNIAELVNLTMTEKGQLPNIDDTRYPYVRRAIKNHAVNHPELVSGFAGTLAEANNDIDLYSECNSIILELDELKEFFVDLQHVAGAEAYKWFLEYYGSTERAKDNQVPGADAVYNDLKPLFDGQGPQNPPPTP